MYLIFYTIKNGERTWPDYIINISDKRIKNSSKLIFYKKIGFLNDKHKYKNSKIIKTDIDEPNNGNNIKKYIIENNRLYIQKYEKKNIFEKEFTVNKYLIPYNK